MELAVGALVGAAAAGGAFTPSPGADVNERGPPTSVAKGGPDCYDGANDDGGRTHVVANGRTWAVTLNATVAHPTGTEGAVNVSLQPTGRYEIALTTVDAAGGRKSPGSGCRAETTVNVATALQRPAFDVTVDGRTARSVDQDETVATLYPLPDPVNATG